MARKTTEELQEELKTLQANFEETVKVQKNIQDRAVAINAILADRAEEEAEKKRAEAEKELLAIIDKEKQEEKAQKQAEKEQGIKAYQKGRAAMREAKYHERLKRRAAKWNGFGCDGQRWADMSKSC